MPFQHIRSTALLASILALAAPVAAEAESVRNIVLVHDAWVDGSGWRPVYEILTKKGFHVTLVQ
jgi:hypothetical protein